MSTAIVAGMACGEHRGRNIAAAPRDDVGNDPAGIFVRPDVENPDIAFAEQARNAPSRPRPSAIPADRTPSIPARRCRAGAPVCRDRDRLQMNPRLERVAIDRPDHIDGWRTSRLPARFQTISASRAAWLSAELGNDRLHPVPHRQHRPPPPRNTNIQGKAAANQRRQEPGAGLICTYSLIWGHIPD
jgi:hypothetical protein